MRTMTPSESGFTLVEIAIVLLIVGVLLGYTAALLPKQQELKKYRAVEQEMNQIVAAIVGFAQVNGRLPCPTIPNLAGGEDGGGGGNCNNYGGFVPVNTLGLTGQTNADSLMLDPWGNPYRYYVANADADADGISDFVRTNEMRDIGLVDVIDLVIPLGGLNDTYIDLDGTYVICDRADATLDDICDAPAVEVIGNAPVTGGPYGGAPFVLVSHGKNWNDAAAAGDELVNMGANLTNDATLAMGLGPSGNQYLLKDEAGGETTFVRRTTGFADDFDDVVKWGSPNLLFSKMIDAGQLP